MEQKRLNNLAWQRERRALRLGQTPAEELLWAVLSAHSLAGFQFRRQHGFGPYILDFYCPTALLAVEADGAGHETSADRQHDHVRDAFLRAHHIRVLRFRNHDILHNLQQVLQEIAQHLHERRPNTHYKTLVTPVHNPAAT